MTYNDVLVEMVRASRGGNFTFIHRAYLMLRFVQHNNFIHNFDYLDGVTVSGYDVKPIGAVVFYTWSDFEKLVIESVKID